MRVSRNHKYSLRAFARDLGIAPSRIVEILQYKRGLSRTGASRIGRALGLKEKEIEIFLNQVDSVHGRSAMIRSRAVKALTEMGSQTHTVLRGDLFKLIADWYHYAILELTAVEDFQSDSSWIAERLDLPKTVVIAAIDRLQRLGLLFEIKGRLQPSEEMTYSTSDIPSDGLKKHHEQILDKAKDAIFCQSLEQRDFSSMTMAIRRQDIPRAKAMIRRFRREMSTELEQGHGKNVIYSLAIQFFQLDKLSLQMHAPAERPQQKELNHD